MPEAQLAVIGGSGLYRMDGLSQVETVDIETPFGSPSGRITLGTLHGMRVAFLARHGQGHRLMPSELPVRANIYALKTLGVSRIVSASAVGSLREDYRPRDMAVPDQLFDRTRSRPSTFFGNGITVHVGFAHPFCTSLRDGLLMAARQVVERTHDGGTYVCMEGPAFSTYAESTTYQKWGFDLIGMTALPEAKLAREAEMCHAVLAQVTDYDCWHQEHDVVSGELVVETMAENAKNAQEIISSLIGETATLAPCSCGSALDGAILTDPAQIDADTRSRLRPLLARALGEKMSQAAAPSGVPA